MLDVGCGMLDVECRIWGVGYEKTEVKKRFIFDKLLKKAIMEIEMSFLKRPSFNVVEGYKRFRYTEDYVKQKYNACFDGLDTQAEKKARRKEISIQLGYANFSKFDNHLEQFLELKRAVPVKFMQAIGIEDHVLDFTVETDHEHYCEALKYQYSVDHYIVRIFAAMYDTRKFRDSFKEEEAVAFCLAFCKENRCQCMVNILDLKSIFLYPDGKNVCRYFYPKHSKNKEYYVFTSGNEDYGTTRVG